MMLYTKDEFSNQTFYDTQCILKDDLAMIFAPKKSYITGYTLLARPVQFFEDISAEEMSALSRRVSQLDRAYQQFIPEYNGYTLLVNRGVIAGQRVPHTHVHFFPHQLQEVTHPLYQQLSPEIYRLTDPGLVERVNELKGILGGAVAGVIKTQTVSVININIETGIISPHQIITFQEDIYFEDLSIIHAGTIISKIRDLVRGRHFNDNQRDGYSLIIPSRAYGFKYRDRTEVSVVWRSSNETENPNKLLRIKI
jgi:diadenosine tetraphosphate (Ap4A) HIT family hydrolase